MDRFKAEEMARMDRKIEDSRDGIRREMEFLYSRNIQALNVRKQYSDSSLSSFYIVYLHYIHFGFIHSQEANQNLTAKHEKSASPVHSQPERDVDNYKEMQIQAIHKLEQQMKKQVSVEDGYCFKTNRWMKLFWVQKSSLLG